MSFKQHIENWMEETRVALIAEYDRQGLRASGSYAKSLEPEISESGSGFRAVMKSAKHAYWMQNGRRPNQTKSPEQAKMLYPIISEWVRNKGLNFDKGHIFAICLKIVYEGINVPNRHNPGGVVDNVVNRDRIDKLMSKIGAAFQEQIKSDVIKILK